MTTLAIILMAAALLWGIWKLTLPLLSLLSHHAVFEENGHELPGQLREIHDRHRLDNTISLINRIVELLKDKRFTGVSVIGIRTLTPHPDYRRAYDSWRKGKEKLGRFVPSEKQSQFTYEGPKSVTELDSFPRTDVWHLSFVNLLPVVWRFRLSEYGGPSVGQIQTIWLFRTGAKVVKLLKKAVWKDNTVMVKYEKKDHPRTVVYRSLYAAGGKLKVTINQHSFKDLKNLILEDGVIETFHAVIEGFGKSRKLYTTLGIPYKLGILLQGLPGTGKTSLIKALAGHYGAELYFVNMSTMTSALFTEAVERLQGVHGIIVMEDLDATGVQTNREDSKEKDGVRLSQLLNFLDGADTPDSSVIIITTNHPEAFDSALVRPGRIDHIINMHGLPPERAILVLQNTLEAAELDKHMLGEKFQEKFGEEKSVQPAAVQQFAQTEIFGYTYQPAEKQEN